MAGPPRSRACRTAASASLAVVPLDRERPQQRLTGCPGRQTRWRGPLMPSLRGCMTVRVICVRDRVSEKEKQGWKGECGRACTGCVGGSGRAFVSDAAAGTAMTRHRRSEISTLTTNKGRGSMRDSRAGRGTHTCHRTARWGDRCSC